MVVVFLFHRCGYVVVWGSFCRRFRVSTRRVSKLSVEASPVRIQNCHNYARAQGIELWQFFSSFSLTPQFTARIFGCLWLLVWQSALLRLELCDGAGRVVRTDERSPLVTDQVAVGTGNPACCFAGALGMGRSHGRLVHIGPGAMGAVTTKTAKCTISSTF